MSVAAKNASLALIDYKSLTTASLKKMVVDASAQLEENIEKDRTELRAKFETEAAKLGLTASELFSNQYRNPADHKQTWTGRGRKPDWLKEQIANGHKLAEFVIGEVVASLHATKKAKGKKRGPKPGTKQKPRQHYANPDNSTEVYNGVGPHPPWMKKNIAAGVPKESMQIQV